MKRKGDEDGKWRGVRMEGEKEGEMSRGKGVRKMG